MNITRTIKYWNKQQIGTRICARFLLWILLSAVVLSCDTDPYQSQWFDEEALTIHQYLQANQKEYSKFSKLLEKGRLLGTLGAYNPYEDGYTLFLPTDEAVDRFISRNEKYENFDDLLQDTSFVYTFTRYHTINRKIHTDKFPDGALTDLTLTGNRLVTGVYTDSETDNPLIKINNVAPVVKSNLEMTNGYIHVVSEVLQKVEISGYDWLQQQDEYSILAQAMEYSRIRQKMWMNTYTIFAEQDSIYRNNGILNLDDLLNHIAPPGASGSAKTNALFKFAAYHIMSGEFYLNDFSWGTKGYWTMDNKPVTVKVGLDIRINPGLINYGMEISDSGDTTVIDYIEPIWDDCNILTRTGPVHSISNLLTSEPLP